MKVNKPKTTKHLAEDVFYFACLASMGFPTIADLAEKVAGRCVKENKREYLERLHAEVCTLGLIELNHGRCLDSLR